MWTLIVLLSVPVLLYVPFVQDFVKDVALKEVAKSSGMVIDVDRFRLKWPLRVELDGVRVIPAPGDTMVNARIASLNVEMLPLLSLDIRVDGHLEDVDYRLGTPDSAMYLTAAVKRFDLSPSSYDLKNAKLRILVLTFAKLGHIIFLISCHVVSLCKIFIRKRPIQVETLSSIYCNHRTAMRHISLSIGVAQPSARR